jgi:hypothetical protein
MSRVCLALAAASACVATAAPAAAVSVTVDGATVTNPSVSRRWLGCHQDQGFAQAPRGVYAQMVYGGRFDRGAGAVPAWTPFFANTTTSPAPALDTAISFSAKPSLSVAPDAPGAVVGMSHRGQYGAGLVFVAGREYEVEAFTWTGAGAGREPGFFFELVDFTTGAVLAHADVQLVSTGPPWGTTWVKVSATLVPTASTACVEIPYGSDPTVDCGAPAGPAHVCVRCAGALRFGVVGKSDGGVNVGWVSLLPGAWARVPRADGTGASKALASMAAALTNMGVSLIRFGGSVSQSLRWKDWRGEPWARPSNDQLWGSSLIAGWGPFENLQLAEDLGIEAVVTLAYDVNDADDFGDLVEYLYGDAAGTSWGRRRAADGHPRPYTSGFTFELGCVDGGVAGVVRLAVDGSRHTRARGHTP